METTVRGTIFPAERDGEGNILRVVIDTEEQDAYFIDPHGKGKELLKLLDHKVQLNGALKEDVKGNWIISVKAYTLLEKDIDKGQAFV